MSVDKIYRRMFCANYYLFIGVDFESLRPCYAGLVNSKYCSGTKLFFLQLVSCFIPFSDLLLYVFLTESISILPELKFYYTVDVIWMKVL